jgi:hypothetical protein
VAEYTLVRDEAGNIRAVRTEGLQRLANAGLTGAMGDQALVMHTDDDGALVAGAGSIQVRQGTMFRTIGGMVSLDKKMKRDPRDFYPTPAALCRAAVRLVPDSVPEHPWVLDPGAGLGPWGEAVRERWPAATLVGVELDPRIRPHPVYNLWHSEDYLALRTDASFDLIIGNPPYSQAEAFIRKAQGQLSAWGHMFLLLRLEFLASQTRGRGLFRHYPPTTVHVCIKRPSFLGERSKRTDATEYGLFHWWGNGTAARPDPAPRLMFWDWSPPDACLTVRQPDLGL